MITGHYPSVVISLMKDEFGGKTMTDFVALRAKMYAYRRIEKEVEEKHCKGTKKCVVSQGLTFDDYKTCLFDVETVYREQKFLRIRSMRCTRLINIRYL